MEAFAREILGPHVSDREVCFCEISIISDKQGAMLPQEEGKR
jgi:hypothetical protein